MGEEDITEELLLEALILYSKQERFSNFQVFLPSSPQGTINTRETYFVTDKEQVLIISSVPSFPLS
jgi:hypothetical protein